MRENERLEELLKENNTLLQALLETLNNGITVRRIGQGGRPRSFQNLDPDIKESVEEEIDLEWWFLNYGEEALPAKYLCPSMGIPAPGTNAYTKEESDYLFARLQDFLEEPNEAKTHTWTYLGKVWCPREKNARNCFAFVPIVNK